MEELEKTNTLKSNENEEEIEEQFDQTLEKLENQVESLNEN